MRLRDVFRPVDPLFLLAATAAVAFYELRGHGLGVAFLVVGTWIVLVLLRVFAAVLTLTRAVAELPEVIGSVAANKVAMSMTPPELKP